MDSINQLFQVKYIPDHEHQIRQLKIQDSIERNRQYYSKIRQRRILTKLAELEHGESHDVQRVFSVFGCELSQIYSLLWVFLAILFGHVGIYITAHYLPPALFFRLVMILYSIAMYILVISY